MGLFSKIKSMFQKKETIEEEQLIETEIDEVEEKLEKVEVKTKKEEKSVKKEEPKNNNVKVYEKGLTKSRQGFVSKLADLTNRYKKVTDEYFDELEEILIMADIGVNTVMDFIDRLRDRVRVEKLDDPEMLKEIIVDELFIIYVNDSVLTSKLTYNENGPTAILFVGVNGVGKTTTIGKIGYQLKNEGKKVLLVATGSLHSQTVVNQKLSIPAIAHAVSLEVYNDIS